MSPAFDGYDDNTPLTGVTGGGLPAEIWKQVMTRVSDGEIPRALPYLPPAEMPIACQNQCAPSERMY